jgi:hypothetical protein
LAAAFVSNAAAILNQLRFSSEEKNVAAAKGFPLHPVLLVEENFVRFWEPSYSLR